MQMVIAGWWLALANHRTDQPLYAGGDCWTNLNQELRRTARAKGLRENSFVLVSPSCATLDSGVHGHSTWDAADLWGAIITENVFQGKRESAAAAGLRSFANDLPW